MENLKYCNGCKEFLLLENFGKRSDRKSGVKSECKKCLVNRHKMWRDQNEKHLIEYRQKTADKRKLNGKKYREKNKELCKKQREIYKEKNKEKIVLAAKIYRQNNADRLRDYNLKKKFNISLEEYNIMLKNQNEVCAICKRPERMMHNGKIKYLCVDHNHKTGAVRKLLCHGCNSAIALFEENIDYLNNAIDYLK